MSETNHYEQVLGCRNLPTLPTIAVQLLELTRRPDVALSDIAKLVKNDIGLSARVLKTINSSIFSLRQPCNSIDRALALLGLNTVKSIVLGFSLVDSTKGVAEGQGFDLSEYWKRAIYAAAGARAVAEAGKAADPDDAFVAALFQDMGVMASFVALGKAYADVLVGVPSHDALAAAEQEKLGFTHMQAGSELAKRWKLPERTVESIAHHHNPDGASPAHATAVRCVAIGGIAAESLLAENPGPAVSHLYAKAREWFGFRREDVAALMGRISTAAEELGKLFEKDMGQSPDLERILESANNQLVEHQMASQSEAEALRLKTITDALTGAFNRQHFNDQLPTMFEECKSAGKPMGAIFLDADRFKSVNDTHGHAAGDAVLIELAARVKESVGGAGLACRYGGEEFAVLLPGVGVEGTRVIAERIRGDVEKTPFDLSKVPNAPATLAVTVSAGVSATDLASGAPIAPEELVRQADEAVYASKKGGRNRVSVHAPVSVSAAVSRGVLVVEDDSLAAALLIGSLKKANATGVQWVRSCQAAMDFLKRVEAGKAAVPQLVLCDLNLKDGQSTAFITALRRAPGGKQAVVLGMSADETATTLQREAGADAFMSKHEIATNLSAWVAKALSQVARAA